MYANQVLEFPGSAGADREATAPQSAPVAEAAAVPIHVQERPQVTPRRSIDTLLAVAALVFSLGVTRPEIVPLALSELLALPLPLQDVLLLTLLFAAWPRVMQFFGLYHQGPVPVRAELLAVALACSAGSLLALSLVHLGSGTLFTATTVGAFWVVSTGVTVTFRGFAQALNTSVRSRVRRRVLVLGSGARAANLSRFISGRPEEYELLGYVDRDNEELGSEMRGDMIGALDKLEEILMHQVVDEVLIALPIKSCYADIQRAIEVCERVGVESKYLADVFNFNLARPRYEQHRSSLPFLTMKVYYDDYRVAIKRAVDVVGAAAGLLVLSPLLLGIALAIKLTSPGPVLFAQERYGLNKRRFRMLKFRTMVPGAERLQAQLEAFNEATGPAFKIKDDPRVTRVGKWLRKTSLDELPQLINVLLGEMSLVGPRPMAVRDVKLFDEAWFMRRFSAPPGMTGLWQVSGRSNLGFDDWVALDLKYIDEWSLGLDLQILARTVPVVVRGVGAM